MRTKWASITKAISEGHAWTDHALKGEFGPIDSQDHFAQLIYNVMLNAENNFTAKPLGDGNRYAYWYQNILVIYDADKVDSGSCYPATKQEYNELH